MYNDEENMNRPKFDSKTGKPIYYDNDGNNVETNGSSVDMHSDNQTAAESGNGTTEYRYSRSDIPFSRVAEKDAETVTDGTDNGTESSSYSNNNINGNINANMDSNNSTSNMYNTTGSTGFNGMSGNAQNAATDNGGKKKKKKAGKGFFKSKLVRLIGSAALFGVIAGGIMFGMYYAGVKIFPSSTSKSNYEIASVSSNVTSTSAVTSEGSDASANAMNIQSVSNAALPAMVELDGTETVSGSSSNSFYGMIGGNQSYQASTSGTGIIVGKNDTELLILTNAHVVSQVDNLTCVFVDGESVSATVKGSKSDKDIAVVAVDLSSIKDTTLGKIAIAELGDSDDATVGQQVVAIGNALGEGQSVTTGIISALNRTITIENTTYSGLFMTDAAINAGNSGGALLNSQGEVIGINCAKTSEDGVEGMAYSIPVSNVKDLIDSLMNRQTRTKVGTGNSAYLGISAIDITSSMSSTYGYPQGVMIRQVSSGSAAEKAGLGAYDIIVSFDDQSISSMSGLQNLMQYYSAGETVTVEYYHLDGSQYEKKTIQVTLDKKS
jgi:serine protease Do